MSTEKQLNIGLIGAGWWANTMHMPALAACDQANVVAVCDLIPERAEALAQKYHIPHTFTDYKQLLDSGLCEAVIVVITNDAHYPVTMDALNRGLHAICEKPLAISNPSSMRATCGGPITCTCATTPRSPAIRGRICGVLNGG